MAGYTCPALGQFSTLDGIGEGAGGTKNTPLSMRLNDDQQKNVFWFFLLHLSSHGLVLLGYWLKKPPMLHAWASDASISGQYIPCGIKCVYSVGAFFSFSYNLYQNHGSDRKVQTDKFATNIPLMKTPISQRCRAVSDRTVVNFRRLKLLN